MMPLMRGDEMLTVLRQNADTAAIPCILMTSATTKLAIKANDFLAKPFDLDRLESLLMRHLG
jgi:CheY-like chemotaxis protein